MAVYSSAITENNVNGLKLLWQFKTRSYVTSKPLYWSGKIYVADWQGWIYCLDERDGKLLYEKQLYKPPKQNGLIRKIPLLKNFLSEPQPYFWNGFAGTGNISGGIWYLSSVGGKEGGPTTNGAPGRLYAVNPDNGKVIWDNALGDTQYSGSLSVPFCDNTTIYSSTESVEEVASTMYALLLRPYKPEAIGEIFAFNKKTGQKKWSRKTVGMDPADNPDARGASVWGGFEFDSARNILFFGTGNNHGEPATKTSDAVIAVSAADGKPLWIFQAVGGDEWLPLRPKGPDTDFGCIPTRFLCGKSSNGYAIGAGNKNGWFYALDSKNGSLLWKTYCHVGTNPDDGIRSDATFLDGKLFVWSRNKSPRKTMSVCCLNAESGALIWNTITRGNNARSTGAVTNRLYFLANYSGELFALSTETGKKIWSSDLKGASAGSSIAIYKNRIYGGMGLPALFGGNPDICGVFAYGFE